jgi:hypothetical protein
VVAVVSCFQWTLLCYVVLESLPVALGCRLTRHAIPSPRSLVLRPSSFVLRPSSFVLRPSTGVGLAQGVATTCAFVGEVRGDGARVWNPRQGHLFHGSLPQRSRQCGLPSRACTRIENRWSQQESELCHRSGQSVSQSVSQSHSERETARQRWELREHCLCFWLCVSIVVWLPDGALPTSSQRGVFAPACVVFLCSCGVVVVVVFFWGPEFPLLTRFSHSPLLGRIGVSQPAQYLVIEPQWITRMLSTIVTLKRNFVNNGRLEVRNLPQVGGERALSLRCQCDPRSVLVHTKSLQFYVHHCRSTHILLLPHSSCYRTHSMAAALEGTRLPEAVSPVHAKVAVALRGASSSGRHSVHPVFELLQAGEQVHRGRVATVSAGGSLSLRAHLPLRVHPDRLLLSFGRSPSQVVALEAQALLE